jgi:RND family efflux transporter MFP subunit
MNKRVITFSVVLLAAVVAGGGYAMKLKRANSAAPVAAASAAAPASAPKSLEIASSDLVTVAPREVRRTLPLTGQLKPANQAVVRAKVGGEIVEMRVKEGQAVKAGELLARIDPADYKARVDEKVGALDASKAQFDYNEKTRRNNEELMRKNFISKNAYDNYANSSSVSQAQVRTAEAQLVQARKALEDTQVKAPIAGVIAERAMQVGDKAAIDSKLISIVDLTRMEIEAAVPAADIPAVAIGQEVRFTVEGFGDKVFTGSIARINPAAAAGSRSLLVYIEVANPEGLLKGGMFAKGGLTLDRRASVLAVPVSALREEAGQAVVYRIEGGKLIRSAVKTGVRNAEEGWIEITEGLPQGAQVVKANLGELKSDVAVNVVQK